MSTPLLITPGDPRGVGAEVAVKAARRLGLDAVLIGDLPELLRVAPELPVVSQIHEGAGGLRALDPHAALGDAEPVEIAALRLAVSACLEGRGRALVTGPIHKARLAARGFHHPGHTTFLGELCGVADPVMAFVGGALRVSLVTVHLPIKRVAQAITKPLVLRTLRVSSAELSDRLGIAQPRLLVCGLNPHAGDGGLLGREELDVIAPAISAARAEGLTVEGPVSAEVAFRWMLDGRADMVVAMYHDQGLAPLKLIDFGRSVNWTLGLPIVRTSVDHGTADDLYGQNRADSASMEAAIQLALSLTA
ncbi:MAG: 4-hydroxythreonine-4-phosphate dehydrogenase PdxA [Deltaproteobacteria bacterium]|nr:4-hydroxythreonine-4-phosphate dehydrogenase PdxA [Deltaproteobacteria bacterium]MBK9370650.1 4-hydroxythreonine-4-phosphate dehydrogenase PdxA [Deltaproteobacteria bacterium]